MPRKILGMVLILLFFSIFISLNFINKGNITKISVVGVLSANDLRLNKFTGLKEGLQYYGYNPEKDIKFIIKNAKGDRQVLQSLALELVEEKVDVLVTTGRVETEVARKAVVNVHIPIIFMGITAIEEDDLIKDILHPQEGITGIQNDHAALSGKRLEILTKLIPTATDILVIYDPTVVPTTESIQAIEEAASLLKVNIYFHGASNKEEIRGIFGKKYPSVDGVLLLPSFFLESEGIEVLVPLAMERGWPVMGVEPKEEGELLATYGASPRDIGKQSARLLGKVLQGQPVEEIPIEPPAEIKLKINYAVVEKLNLQINEEVLKFADI